MIEMMPDWTAYGLSGDGDDGILKTRKCARHFCTRKDGSIARYVNAVGQALVDSVEMSVGGTPLAKLPGTWLYVHEELHGHIGRTLYEMVGNEPNANVLEGYEEKFLHVMNVLFERVNYFTQSDTNWLVREIF